MRNIFNQILPGSADNNFEGTKIALYTFYFIIVLTLIRSLIHLLSSDGGSGSIASIPIDLFGNGGREAVIFTFSVWGLSQLLIGIIYVITAFRYRSLIPLMYILVFIEYLGRVLIGQFKPIETLRTAPGEIGNYIFIPLSLIMLLLSINWKKMYSKNS